MTEFEQLLKQAQELQMFRPLDLRFAELVAEEHHYPRRLAAACLSAGTGEGHVCLPLSLLSPQALFSGRQLSVAEQLWEMAGAPVQSKGG